MPARPDPKDFNHSLIPGEAAARQAMLERMRGKLAAPSGASIAREERRRRAAGGKAWAWGWRIALVAAFLGANAFILGSGDDIAAVAKVRRAPSVQPPRSLAPNDQALYWTYALYDFDRLKARYGAPANAVIDASEARRRLAELLPKVDERTRFLIRKYHARPGGRA